MPKSKIAREIDEFLSTKEAPLEGTRDVTARLLQESAVGPGPQPLLVAKAAPAKNISQTPTLAATLADLQSRDDRSMGFISKVLAYSKAMPYSKREHANLIRLIKGGYVHVCEVFAPPPPGSFAARDAPYGDRYYVLHVGPCGAR